MGHNGEDVICAEGPTCAVAWRRAAEQARPIRDVGATGGAVNDAATLDKIEDGRWRRGSGFSVHAARVCDRCGGAISGRTGPATGVLSWNSSMASQTPPAAAPRNRATNAVAQTMTGTKMISNIVIDLLGDQPDGDGDLNRNLRDGSRADRMERR
jgi:hypothetical protein